MSVLGHIGRGVEKQLITAIIASGRGKRMVHELCEAPGVLSISHHHARGVGTRRIRKGQQIFKERDVVLILVESENADQIFKTVFDMGQIGEPGGGIVFSETVLRGHPLMPFEGVDW